MTADEADDAPASTSDGPARAGRQRADAAGRRRAATIGADDGEPRPGRRRHRQEQADADEQRPQPAERRRATRRHHGRGGDPASARPVTPRRVADEPGDERRRSSAITAMATDDPPQLVGRVAPDHEQLQVDPDDLPAPVTNTKRSGPVQHVAATTTADDDRDDAVADGAEQVAADPVAGPGRRRALGLGRRDRHRLGGDASPSAPHRSTIARRRLTRLTTSEMTSEITR